MLTDAELKRAKELCERATKVFGSPSPFRRLARIVCKTFDADKDVEVCNIFYLDSPGALLATFWGDNYATNAREYIESRELVPKLLAQLEFYKTLLELTADDDNRFFIGRDEAGQIELQVNANDFFYFATGDCEPVPHEEWKTVVGLHGEELNQWLEKKRGVLRCGRKREVDK